jgi:hypothetical protein
MIVGPGGGPADGFLIGASGEGRDDLSYSLCFRQMRP